MSYVGSIPSQVSIVIDAPTLGWVGPLGDVPDPAFAQGMMGDGMMLDPLAGDFRAPCDAEVIAVAPTAHSVTLRLANGAELLMHVGIDTVGLGGTGFTALVAVGDRIGRGQPLLRCDLDIVARSGLSLRTPIVVINDGYRVSAGHPAGLIQPGTGLFEIVSIGPTEVGKIVMGSHSEAVAVLPLTHGLHARPSARLATVARGWQATATVACHGRSANAASVSALMTLGAMLGDSLTISADGADAAEMVQALFTAIAEGLGEQPFPITAPAPTAAKPAVVAPLDPGAVLVGVSGAGGVVIGHILQLQRADAAIERPFRGAIEERAALRDARATASARLSVLAEGAPEARAEILAAHGALLDDPDIVARADTAIAIGSSAAIAWRSACRSVSELLATLDNARLRERGEDLHDIEHQVLAVLLEVKEDHSPFPADTIVIADSLVPTEFLALAARGVAAICTTAGGATSHVSILAAGAGIPALAAVDARARGIADGTPAILDADRAQLHVAPAAYMVEALQIRIAARRDSAALATAQAHEQATTVDGLRVLVLANLGGVDGAAPAVQCGAEGCGLLRSEFLFLDRAVAPDETEQRRHYQAVADAMPGGPLVIRTLDIGGDKPVPFLTIAPEENPALGLRGIRLSLRYPELLRVQFRAMLGISGSAQIQIMLPMVIEASEVRAARAIFEEEAQSLGRPAIPLGIMVETPAAALLADTLAPHADFFSIGTNDLTQYALAIDRASVPLAGQADGLHPAVLRLIKACCFAAAKAGKPVGVCGALGGDPLAIPLLLGLGVSRLSVASGRVAAAKAVVRRVTLHDCQRVAHEMCEMDGPAAVRAAVRAKWPELENWS